MITFKRGNLEGRSVKLFIRFRKILNIAEFSVSALPHIVQKWHFSNEYTVRRAFGVLMFQSVILFTNLVLTKLTF